jgi:hypothetical protein
MDENGNPMDFSNWGGEYQPFQGDRRRAIQNRSPANSMSRSVRKQ